MTVKDDSELLAYLSHELRTGLNAIVGHAQMLRLSELRTEDARRVERMIDAGFYLVGILATVWHLANGLWLFAVDWGIVIGERAQRLTGYACIAIGLLLLAVGINAQVAFLRPGGLLGGILY